MFKKEKIVQQQKSYQKYVVRSAFDPGDLFLSPISRLSAIKFSSLLCCQVKQKIKLLLQQWKS